MKKSNFYFLYLNIDQLVCTIQQEKEHKKKWFNEQYYAYLISMSIVPFFEHKFWGHPPLLTFKKRERIFSCHELLMNFIHGVFLNKTNTLGKIKHNYLVIYWGVSQVMPDILGFNALRQSQTCENILLMKFAQEKVIIYVPYQ